MKRPLSLVRWLSLVGVLSALMMLVAACAPAPAAPTEAPAAEEDMAEEDMAEGEETHEEDMAADEEAAADALIVNVGVAPATLDPAVGCIASTVGFLQHFYVRLTQYGTTEGPDGTLMIDPSNIEPYFAEDIQISDDGLTYTFTLPEGATFAGSGEPVNAEAVKYSIERTLTMANCGEYFILLGIYDPYLIQEINVVDEYVVEFVLARPEPNFLQALAMPAASIVDPSVVEANGGVEAATVNDYMAFNVAGSGPFLMESYEPNVRAVLVANPDYFGEAPGAERIMVNFVNSDATLLQLARSGEADVTLGMSFQSINSLEDDENVRIVANETTNSIRVGMPNDMVPFDNATFREALTYAIPYEDIVEQVAFGYGDLFYGPLPPSMNEYNEELGVVRSFDLERARELIAESGVATPVDITMVVQEGNSTDQQIATIVQGIWRELGVNVEIQVLSAADYVGAVEGHTAQSFIRIDGTGVYDAGYLLGFDMVCALADSFNTSAVCIPEADELLDQARQELDPEARQELYDQITQLWLDNSPFIQVMAVQDVVVLSPEVDTYFWSHLYDMRMWSKN